MGRSGLPVSSDRVALGRAVHELRERRGLTQYVVAYDAGLGDKYVRNLEGGRAHPSFDLLLWIVRTLGYTLRDLVDAYERHLTAIDPHAGKDVPLCPTPAALAHRRHLNDIAHARNLAAIRRGRMGPWT